MAAVEVAEALDAAKRCQEDVQAVQQQSAHGAVCRHMPHTAETVRPGCRGWKNGSRRNTVGQAVQPYYVLGL
jgi:hypothetical protein